MSPDRAAQIVAGRPSLAAMLRAEGVRPWPAMLPEEAIRVPRLTGLMVYRLQTEAALMEPASLGAAMQAGATYVEAPADVLRALYDRIESAEFLTDAGTTEAQQAFAERAQEQSRLSILARLADALGDHRQQKKR